jgi:PmbA protein
MLEQVLDIARANSEQAEVYDLVEQTTPVVFEANRLKELQTKQSHGLALRLVRNGRIGLASTTDFRDLPAMVDRAITATEFGAAAQFLLPDLTGGTRVEVYDRDVEQMSTEQMVAVGQELIDRVHAYDADILCSLRISKSTSTATIANTRGGYAFHTKTLYSISLDGNLTTDTDILEISETASSCRAEINAERLVTDLVNKFDLAKRTARVTTKTMPVIFAPKGVSDILYLPLQLAFNGKLALQGASPLTDKVGEQVLDPRISLYDDGTIDYAPRSGNTDHEGTPCQQTALVDQGVVQGFLYDLQTAGLAGKKTTGNGFRSVHSLPYPAFTSLVFAEGDTLLLDMIEDIKEGILVDQVMGAWAGNLLAGELSGNVHLGFKIENGQLVGRVKDTMVAGNMYQALSQGIEALGSENVWVEGQVFAPPIYFKGLSVASKQS